MIYHKERNKNNTRWAQHTIKALCDFGVEIWTKRNNIKYGTIEEIEISEKSKLKTTILKYYQNQDKVPPIIKNSSKPHYKQDLPFPAKTTNSG